MSPRLDEDNFKNRAYGALIPCSRYTKKSCKIFDSSIDMYKIYTPPFFFTNFNGKRMPSILVDKPINSASFIDTSPFAIKFFVNDARSPFVMYSTFGAK